MQLTGASTVFAQEHRSLVREGEHDSLRGGEHTRDKTHRNGSKVRVEVLRVVIAASTSVEENQSKQQVQDRRDDETANQRVGVAVHVDGFALHQGGELCGEGTLGVELNYAVAQAKGLLHTLEFRQHRAIGLLLLQHFDALHLTQGHQEVCRVVIGWAVVASVAKVGHNTGDRALVENATLLHEDHGVEQEEGLR